MLEGSGKIEEDFEDRYYELNPADIIKEEEFEESIGNELSSRKN